MRGEGLLSRSTTPDEMGLGGTWKKLRYNLAGLVEQMSNQIILTPAWTLQREQQTDSMQRERNDHDDDDDDKSIQRQQMLLQQNYFTARRSNTIEV